MSEEPAAAEPVTRLSLAAMGGLIGDPVRAAVLLALSDGQPRAAGELALFAGASPQGISPHLARLLEAGFLRAERAGRRRLFRIASGEVAELMEALAHAVADRPAGRRIDPALGRARFCYDHLAGRLGVAIYDAMLARHWLTLGADGPDLTPDGHAACAAHGLDLTSSPGSRRPAVRLCLDWTERRPHCGGRLGAALAASLLAQGHLRRWPGQRIVDVTPAGAKALRAILGVTCV